MSVNNLYYLYIDTKIEGALEQLIRYFQAQVFNVEDCISVYCKYYKEIEKKFTEEFNKHNISFKFIKKNSDLVFNNGKIVFYLFNAQSNCRIVANRNLIHVFVTHGESHKLASVKPIIKIYDYVVTSGDVGIDRYLKSGIFTPFDIRNGKVIKLGNTFIGHNYFQFDVNSRSAVYAPTWEGGIPEENYSSINNETTHKIIKFCKIKKINILYIQAHPNIGHRDHKYKAILNESIRLFTKAGLIVYKITNGFIEGTRFPLIKLRRKITNNIKVSYALTDISAMEVQFHSRKIPCGVIVNGNCKENVFIPKKILSYYKHNLFHVGDDILNIESCPEYIQKYILSYSFSSLENMSFKQRIRWLCEYLKEDTKI
ncbi:hypothetical protein FQH21_27520, partial [Escherichia coli]|nr:hypothetical protein [Escherichia coli]EGE2619028.1 hypothetical protein [Escherichia coli]EIH6242086.1 hypothetical protein [Escherichia coli]EIX5800906.1 hypothetical protein [Escherichia coli]HBQ4570827.1 hypothetical protein [Escherichia coli]